VAASTEVDQERTGGAATTRLARDVTESLARLGEAADVLGRVDDSTDAAHLAACLAAMERHAAQFDERFARLAPHLAAPVSDVADELTDAAETLSSRWDGLVAGRREALLAVVLARRSALDAVLGAVGGSGAGAGAPAKAETPDASPSPPSAPRSKSTGSIKDAAKAWEAWTHDLSVSARDLFMRLSQSWIEGTGAQLVRDVRSPSSPRSNVTDVTARVRHHLVLLAESGTVPYAEALATARRRVSDELHG
jgi:hypothetical protein